MPFPNEHAARQTSPTRYKKFRRQKNKFGQGVDAIWGVLDDGKTELQSIRFDKSKFTPAQAKAWLKEHKMKTGIEAASSKANTSLNHITVNFRPEMRYDEMEGRKYLVVPSIPIVEGVHNGSGGALYYPGEELAKTPQVWNHKPVVVYHPEINGMGVSACDPAVLTARKVGVMMNTEYADGKLRSELWLDEERCNLVDKRILEAVQNNKMMEVSTGLFTDDDYEQGEWNGEQYEAIARNYRPDHLALLPDKVGACSIEDGAGFLRANEAAAGQPFISQQWADTFFPALNAVGIDTDKLTALELSHDQTRMQIASLLRNKSPNKEAWVEDVWPNYFIYAADGRLYKQAYKVNKDGVVTLEGIAAEVVRVVEYKQVTLTKRNKSMDKKEKLIKAIIANEHIAFGEDDAEFLESCDVETLEKMNIKPPVANVKDEPAPKEPAAPVLNQEPTTPKPKTVAEFMADAPPEIKRVLTNGLNAHNAEVKRLVNTITANPSNTLTEQRLNGMDVEDLRAIAALSRQPGDDGVQLFTGQGDVVANANVGPLPIPPAIVGAAQKAD